MAKKRNKKIPLQFARIIESGFYVWIGTNLDGSQYSVTNNGIKTPIQPDEYEREENE